MRILVAALAAIAISGCIDESPATPDESPQPPDESPATPDESPQPPDESPATPDECPEDPGESPEDPGESPEGCPAPLAAVLRTLQCVEEEDVECASAGYSPDFVKYHNGVDTNATLDWANAFKFVDLVLDMNHELLVGPNQVSLRYVESVIFEDGEVLLQHEHALVTVDDQCRMTFWDQYGDNAEQRAVELKIIEIIINSPRP